MKKSTVFNNLKKGIRQGIFFLALLFCCASFIRFSAKGEEKKAIVSGISVLYVFLPLLGQKLFNVRLNSVLYLFVMAYTISPLLGYSYNLYYLTSWWDDVLHAFSGVFFGIVGAYLPTLFCKNEEVSFPLRAFCAFSFSVAVAGLWELAEFSADSFFATDMQKDTLLTDLPPSYLLSELLGFPIGTLGELNGAQITINGQTVNHYVDLGLIDSMQDIFIETLGAAIYTALYCAGKGKRFCLQRKSA
jgi:hypothetical protein